MTVSGVLLLSAAACLGVAATLMWITWQRRQHEEAALRARLGRDLADGRGRPMGSDEFSGPLGVLWKAICYRLWAAGLDLSVTTVKRSALAALAAGALLWMLLGPWTATILMGSLLAVLGVYVARERARRHTLLIESLPRGLDYLARAQIAGNSIETALINAGRELPEPLAGLLRSVARQVDLGASLHEVLHETGDIHGLDDFHMLALATFVNRRYGGDLTQILRDLAAVIRDRQRAEAELRAATGETRVSAWVLVLIPVGLVAYVLVQNPDYYGEMWGQPVGRALLLTSAALQLCGAAMIWRMLRAGGKEG